MLVLALNYIAAQLLMEYAQSANEFKARLTIQRANRIFVNVQENIPLHVGFLTGAMVIVDGSGFETSLAYATIAYTAARTAWLVCYKTAPKPMDASNLLSLLFGAPSPHAAPWKPTATVWSGAYLPSPAGWEAWLRCRWGRRCPLAQGASTSVFSRTHLPPHGCARTHGPTAPPLASCAAQVCRCSRWCLRCSSPSELLSQGRPRPPSF